MRPIVAASTAALTLLTLQTPQWGLLATTANVGQSLQPLSTPTRTLTLITGDKLLLGPAEGRAVTVQPAKGREAITFTIKYELSGEDGKQHMYVTPMDAAPLIVAGTLDRTLFDVTALMDSGYDDVARNSLPLIVTYQSSQTRGLTAARTSLAGATVTQRLDSVNGEAVQVSKDQAATLWSSLTASTAGARSAQAASSLASSIRKVWLDRMLQPALDRSATQIGAPTAWASGYTGAGVVVGVLDTGVDATHPDLAGKVIAQENFVSMFEPDIADHVGHGTHVASTIAGTGAASGGRYRGIAPDAQLITGKVCFSQGCPSSSIIAGMEWAVTQGGAAVINMSLGGPATPGVDPMEESINRLSEQYDVLFVVAAGNSGPDAATVGSPSTADFALSVAAVDRLDHVASFSSRGPRLYNRGAKPEISGPGVDIVAARAAGTRVGKPVNDWYTAASGTSMATPHVAGAAAALKQRYPQWGGQQLKATLMSSARFDSTTMVFDYGAGVVDIPAALTTSVVVEPVSLTMGIVPWPHTDDELTTRVVTFHNAGAIATTLSLRTDVKAPNGATPPAGMFTLNPSTLTLPAGGVATATLSVNTRSAAPDGLYSGRLIATADGKTLSLPLAIDREEESYDVVVRHLDRAGTPAMAYDTTVAPLDKKPLYVPSLRPGGGMPGDIVLRLPAGRYRAWSTIDSFSLGMPGAPTMFIESFDLEAPHSLVLDARTGSPVTVQKPTAAAARFFTHIGVEFKLNWGTRGAARFEAFNPFWPDTVYFRQRGGSVRDLTAWIGSQWMDSSTASPTLYAATWVDYKALPAGPTRSVPLKEVAAVRTTRATAFPTLTRGGAGVGTLVNDHPWVGILQSGQPVTLPQQRAEYYYSNVPEVLWTGTLDLFGATPGSLVGELQLAPRQYRNRHEYSVRWNEPPFGPTFQQGGLFVPYRQGDVLQLTAPLHGDRAGHDGYFGSNGPFDASHLYALYKNGVKLGESSGGFGALARLSPEAAVYRFEASATQSMFGLSSQVSSAWTFQSAHMDDTTLVPLPLITIGFQPELNAQGQAFRGKRFQLPITVQQLRSLEEREHCDDRWDLLGLQEQKHDGWCSDKVGRPTVQVSFDDGSTWKTVPVKRSGQQWVAELDHPAQAQYVSLRSSARDFSGNSVEQTVIRAYGLVDRPQQPKPRT